MRRLNRHHRLWWAILALIAVITLSGCQAGSVGQSATHTQATSAATATSTSAASYATPLATALPTAGWAIYRDARYPFLLLLPRDWQIGTASWPAQGPGSCAYYSVGIFPPGVKPLLDGPLAELNPELIEVTLSISCAPEVLDSAAGRWIAEATAVSISSTSATVFDRVDPVDGPILSRDCTASSVFGRLQYIFYEQSPPDTAARDISVFRAILQGFRYTGR